MGGGALVEPQVPGFTLGAILGRGASAAVWSAVRDQDGRRFAVKLLPAATGDPGDTAAQATRELAVLSRIDSDHVVRLHAAVPVDGAIALVLDLVDGGSLASVVSARGHLRAGEVVTTLAPVCRAVADLHAAGVVHADLSPGNVLFTAAGKPMLSDLGVASLTGERPQVVHATAGFVAPEVADGGVPSPESDVYSVGALAWHSLVGLPPSPACDRSALADLVPGLPQALTDVVTRCLDADPGKRPTAAQVAVELYDAAPAEPVLLATGPDVAAQITHRIRSGAAEVAPARRTRHASRARRSRVRWPRVDASRLHLPRRVLAIAGAAVLTVSLAGTGMLWWLLRPATAQASAHSAPTGAVDPGSRRDGIQTATAAVLQRLADARAAALVAKDRSRLAAVYVPGSGPLRKDEAVIGQVVASGASYVDLRLLVREASWVSGSADGATVRARIDTSGYTTRYADGRRTTTKAAAATPVLLTLTWTDGSWRIARMDAA